MAQGGYQVIIILPRKSNMAAARKRSFFAISVFYYTKNPCYDLPS